MHRLTILGAHHPDAMALLAGRSDITVTVVEEALAPRDKIARAVEGTHGIAVRTAKLDGEVLATAPELRIVSRHGVGTDSVDVAWMSARGLPVAIAVGGNDRAVAEHTLTMMLALARDMDRQDRVVREGDWTKRNTLRAFDLEDRTLLIVGCGRIGSRVAELASAFGMRVLARDPYLEAFPEGVEPVADLAEAFGEADIVTVHTPLNDETRHLVDAEALAAMRPGAILINCARGGICDEAAVAAALHDGHLRAYGCDVFTTEPAPKDNPVLTAPNTLLSSHSASMTPASMRRMAMLSIQNVLDCFDGRLRPEMIFNRAELGL